MKWLLAACIIAGAGWSCADDVQKPLVLDAAHTAGLSTTGQKHGRKLKGRFLQITDIHPDPFYKAYSSTEAGFACHRGHGAAGYYGAETSDCDSPLTLVNATFAWIAEHLANEIDFVIWTGDSARHDNDEEIPRTEAQVLGQNRMLVNKFKEVFGTGEGDDRTGLQQFRIPIVPTFGNNDILPHNIFVKGPNRWTKYYQEVWRGIVPEAQRHAFDRGGWFFVEVIPNELAVFSLNTIYFFDSNSAVDGCASKNEPGYEHMEWLRIQLQFLRERGMKAIMSGHVPPARNDEKVGWDETCWQKYTIWMQQYRDVVVGAVYGHMNIEHFVLQDFHDIDYDRAAGNKPSKSQKRLYASADNDFKISLNDAGYLESLRRIWSRLPEVPSTLGWNGVEDPSGHVTQEERDYYDKIGGKFAERFAVSHIAASVVPNYFPALRVFEYNITGLENLVIPGHSGLSIPSNELWYNDNPEEDDSIDVTASGQEEMHTDLKFRDLARNPFTSSRPSTTKKKKKNHFIVPQPPSKRAPPGPAYSPQSLSWLGYTEYYANLTHINNDFAPNPNVSTIDAVDTSVESQYDPLVHAPTSDDDLGILRWNGGKHAGKTPKHEKPRPLNFTYLVEYDTREQGDAYGLTNGSTVRSWLELATRMGEFKPKKAKKHDRDVIQLDEECKDAIAECAENVEDWSDEDVDDFSDDDGFADGSDDMNAEKKKKKKKKKTPADKEKRRRKKVVERTWYAFASRAVVGTLSEEELKEKFGME